jgi:hypothetical protein
MNNNRLTKHEVTLLISALKANVKAAKSGGPALQAKLQRAFEVELDKIYPLQADEVWQKQQQLVHELWQQCQNRVQKRCEELKIPKPFQPFIAEPVWSKSLVRLFKELRAALRAQAYKRIAWMITERFEEIDWESARVQLEIIAASELTETARTFLESLPKVDELIRPLTAQEIFTFMDGSDFKSRRPLPSYHRRDELPEYKPDLGICEE